MHRQLGDGPLREILVRQAEPYQIGGDGAGAEYPRELGLSRGG
jgi:hypothetical protein